MVYFQTTNLFARFSYLREKYERRKDVVDAGDVPSHTVVSTSYGLVGKVEIRRSWVVAVVMGCNGCGL